MRTVYQTTSWADASIVADLLERSEIDASVLGQDIAVAPVTHALGNVRVVVDPRQEASAREVIDAWERREPDSDGEGEPSAAAKARRTGLSRDGVLLGAGFVLLLVAVWYFTSGPGAL